MTRKKMKFLILWNTYSSLNAHLVFCANGTGPWVTAWSSDLIVYFIDSNTFYLPSSLFFLPFLLKYSWCATLYSSQVYNIVIWQLYSLQCDHHKLKKILESLTEFCNIQPASRIIFFFSFFLFLMDFWSSSEHMITRRWRALGAKVIKLIHAHEKSL